MRILGIDPGSVNCGYGVIDTDGSAMRLVEYGVISVKRRNNSFSQRLNTIHDRLTAVIERTKPEVCSMEKVFYAKNVLSIVQLSHARGVAMLACAQSGHEPLEYTPMQVKRSVTGRGAATKEQVQHMVRAILQIDETPELFDATDALAVAICHAVNGGPPPAAKRGGKVSKRTAWKDYVEKNPTRVKNQ